MAGQIEAECGVKPVLVEGGNGVFDVKRDGALIFSKDQVGRFPEPEEVLSKLRT